MIRALVAVLAGLAAVWALLPWAAEKRDRVMV